MKNSNKMAEPKSTETSYRWQILQKEIDLIDGTIKNLDDIIYKTKNFAWLMWGGSLFLIVGYLDESDVNHQLLIFCTVLIPIIFWLMDYQWRKHLRFASEREKIISRFINSQDFLEAIKDEGQSKFPLLDPVGWIYVQDSNAEKSETKPENKNTKSSSKDKKGSSRKMEFDSSYLVDRDMFRKRDIAFYKDAKYFFPGMIVISIAFGVLYGL
jgi:hypothetical protein